MPVFLYPAAGGQFAEFDYRTAIKTVALQELERMHVRSGGYVEFVGFFDREFQGDLEELYKRLLGQTPAILIRAGDAVVTAATSSKKRYDAIVDLELTYFHSHLNSREARLTGDAVVPGLDQMLADARGILLRDLASSFDFANNLLEEAVFSGEEGEVWRHRIQLRTDERPANVPKEGTSATVESIQVDSTIPTAVPKEATKTTTISEIE